MSYSSDYTITSLSSSIEQRTFKNGATRAPFSLGGNGRIGLRGGCIPYIAFGGGQVPSYPKQSDCTGGTPTPPGNQYVNGGYGSGINRNAGGPASGGGTLEVQMGYGSGINRNAGGPDTQGGELIVRSGYGSGINRTTGGPDYSS